jgi:hypothetical protein
LFGRWRPGWWLQKKASLDTEVEAFMINQKMKTFSLKVDFE